MVKGQRTVQTIARITSQWEDHVLNINLRV